MRSRRPIWIGGGVLVFATVLLFALSKPSRMDARVIGQTNDGTLFYVVQVTNNTREPQTFSAWSESTINGTVWERLAVIHGPTIPRNGSHTFTLQRPTEGKRRVTVVCYPLHNST